MKRMVVALALGTVLATSGVALADDFPDSSGHPLRLVGYVLHPVGLAFEWVLARPIWLVAKAYPETFGYDPTYDSEYSWADELAPEY